MFFKVAWNFEARPSVSFFSNEFKNFENVPHLMVKFFSFFRKTLLGVRHSMT